MLHVKTLATHCLLKLARMKNDPASSIKDILFSLRGIKWDYVGILIIDLKESKLSLVRLSWDELTITVPAWSVRQK